jgi:5-carboxymethyl-2-hydroxymuconate isomerase
MPHVVIQYSANLETEVDIPALCRDIAVELTSQKDEEGRNVFPIGGTRVFAYPAVHYAVADTRDDYAFCYINVRIAAGRSDAMKKRAGDRLLERTQGHFASVFAKKHVGVTIQIDESGPGQVYDAKHSNLHPLFKK